MSSPLRSAVYRCPLLVEKPLNESSAVYHSPLDQSSTAAQSLPFPAWPEIEDPYQSYCLTTLLRAPYFHKYSKVVKPKVAEKRKQEYLSRPEAKERFIEEAQAQADIYAMLIG